MTNHGPADFAKLIPELPSWNNGRGISVDAWIRCMGNFELAVGYSRVFWPGFVEHEGCILFEDYSLETYSAFMKQCDGDRARVEALMNHLHLVDLHAGATATEEQVVYLGRVLKASWEAKLARDFPDRSFVVSFSEGPFEDLLKYHVTFWQTGGGSVV